MLAAAKLALTMAFAGAYGFHRDELYYLASARHLQWGYTDYPPITPLLARLDQALFPGSLIGLRLLPALAGAVIVAAGGLIARELGGGTRAQVLAAFAVLVSPIYLGGDFMFQTVAFDQLWWALACLVLVRILRGGDQRLWLLLGAVLGLGLETKYTIAGLVVVLPLALLLSAQRRLLASPWPWLGAGLAVVMLLPNLWWQAGHGWDSVAYTLNHRGHTDGPIAYWLQQLLTVHPLLLPVVVMGGVWLARRADTRPLAWILIGVEVLFFAAGGKSYYPAPIFVLAYAAGACWFDEATRSVVLRRAAVVASAIVTAILLPLGLPVLPASVMAQSGLWKVRKDYAEMYGWPDLAEQVAAAYRSVPAAERPGTAILAINYGEAGAIDLFGPGLGLPGAISPHLTYYWWAQRPLAPTTVVTVGFSRERLAPLFGDIEPAGTVHNSYGLDNEENGAPIFICRDPLMPLDAAWSQLKSLN